MHSSHLVKLLLRIRSSAATLPTTPGRCSEGEAPPLTMWAWV